LSYFKKYFKVNDDDVLCNELSYNCFIEDIKYKKLLKAITNQDFKDLIPNINQRYNYSEIYIINTSKNLIYHLYDDRDLWLAFHNNQDYLRCCNKYSQLVSNIVDKGI
jgi:hypothetical protein